jgi:serine/threonine protein kinase
LPERHREGARVGIAKALIEPYRLGGSTADVAAHAATLVMDEPINTAQGARLGTLPYMSPEQWGAGEINERTDMWPWASSPARPRPGRSATPA